MTFQEWLDHAGFTYLAPPMCDTFKEIWTVAQEAMRERAARYADYNGTLEGEEIARAIRHQLEVE